MDRNARPRLAALGLAACGDEVGGNERRRCRRRDALDPADFTTEIDNPWWPMTPGSRWVYRETDSEGANQKVVVTVTDRTKTIANGIEARVVHDVVTEDGKFVEVTDDWYAQDQDGNVWYLGEDTTEYENGKPVSTAGSFEAGVDGAEAGIIVPAQPEPGMTYRQEYYKGEAEDQGAIVSLDQQAEVPVGPLRAGADDQRHQPARAEGERVQVLRPRRRPGPGDRRLRRSDREELLSYQAG